MKKTIFAALVSLAMSMSAVAQAENRVEAPLWDCALAFTAEGGGFQLLVGHYKLTGRGTISCVDIAGNTQKMKVKITMGGAPVSLSVAMGHVKVAGVATGIGIATDPSALLGKYYAVNANAAVIAGAGANFAVRGGKEAATMNVGISLARGLGLQLGVNKLKIEAAN